MKNKKKPSKLLIGGKMHFLFATILAFLLIADILKLHQLVASSDDAIDVCLTIYSDPKDNKPCLYPHSEKKGLPASVPVFRSEDQKNEVRLTDFVIAGEKIISDQAIANDAAVLIGDKQPIVRGKLDAPYAYAQLSLIGDKVIVAGVQADANGCFTWRPPRELSSGEQKLFLSASGQHQAERNEQKDYFVANFVINRGEKPKATALDASIRPATPTETRLARESADYRSFLAITNNDSQVASGGEVNFSFDGKKNKGPWPKSTATFRLRRGDGQILAEKKVPTEEGLLPLRLSFPLAKDYGLGAFYIESSVEVSDGVQLTEQAPFMVVYEKNIPFFGIAKVSTPQAKATLARLLYGLVFFLLAPSAEIYLIKRHHAKHKISGKNLKGQAV